MSNAIQKSQSYAPVANWSLEDVLHAAKVVAASGLFGVRTPEEAATLMLLAQSEGRHPVMGLREYHVISVKDKNGRMSHMPVMKSMALLARFQMSGGRVQWLEMSDTKVRAKFSHEEFNPEGVIVEYTIEMARRAGLTNKPNWRMYPQDMLVARTIARGVRLVNPAVALGLYTYEEMVDADADLNGEENDVNVVVLDEQPGVIDGQVREPQKALDGKPEGKAEGKSEGKVEGKPEGKPEGKAEGKAEGKPEGKQKEAPKPERPYDWGTVVKGLRAKAKGYSGELYGPDEVAFVRGMAEKIFGGPEELVTVLRCIFPGYPDTMPETRVMFALREWIQPVQRGDKILYGNGDPNKMLWIAEEVNRLLKAVKDGLLCGKPSDGGKNADNGKNTADATEKEEKNE